MKVADIESLGYRVRLKDEGRNLGVSPDTVPKEIIEQIRTSKQSLIEELLLKEKDKPNYSTGTELAKLFDQQHKLLKALLIKPGCGPCKDLEDNMNQLGPAGCRENKECIVNKIHNRAKRNSIVASMFSGTVKDGIEKLVEQAIENTSKSVVWVYWAGGADGDELRYSIRSVMTNLRDVRNVTICGDKPEWFTGHFIHSPRFNRKLCKAEFGSGRFAKWIDSIIKLEKICDDPNITEDFLWMYDDTFIVKPTSIIDLARPRVKGQLHAGSYVHPVARCWREVRRRTHKSLADRELPTHDYSTHLPIVYNKTKLRETFDTFDPRHSARAIESLYMNHHYDSPEYVGDMLQYQKRVSKGWHIKPSTVVVNVGGFNRYVEEAISPLFSNPSELEDTNGG